MLIAAYIPQDRRQALARGVELPDRSHGAAVLADISGFTPMAQAYAQALGPRRGAEELARQLNQVYNALIAEVDGAGGSVIYFNGDGIICWFDDRSWGVDAATQSPHSYFPAPARAVACACALQ